MALDTDLQIVSRHITDVLESEKPKILITAEGPSLDAVAFDTAKYGEPRVITRWPFVSIQPQAKTREIKGTRKFDLTFTIWVVIFHGTIASTLDNQEEAHKRAEAVEVYLNSDHKWNFVDPTDDTKDRVIFGHVAVLDHPVVIATEDEFWASSRLELRAESEEVF